MRVGVLTGGGDCPGLNAVIRAVVRKGERQYGDRLLGFRDGWKGVIDNVTMPLDVERCRGILPRGGTILGTTNRGNPFAYQVAGYGEAPAGVSWARIDWPTIPPPRHGTWAARAAIAFLAFLPYSTR